MKGESLCAIYDFELFPFSLGDVLTWNVQTAIRCEEAGRDQVDIFVCLDPRNPVFIFQRDHVSANNCELFFSELFGAFGTGPRTGGFFVYHDREAMIARLGEISDGDEINSRVLADYRKALGGAKPNQVFRDEYFFENVYSHNRINAYAAKYGTVPHLVPSKGCDPDVSGLIRHLFADKRIVVIHMRLRRLDAGYGGAQTYARDSDFLEWFEFLKEAGSKHSDVQFVIAGRIQEKPVELLRLPNVVSIRTLGLGLGHELSLLLRSDLFMGTSSGFAAMANFSKVPYFITNMNAASCVHYGIEPGCDRLPFSTERQILVYEPETRELLMTLLERGLDGVKPRIKGSGGSSLDDVIDVRSWEWERSRWLYPGATTYRYFTDDRYCDKETAFLVWPRVRQASADARGGLEERAWTSLQRIENCFPRMCARFPEFLLIKASVARNRGEVKALMHCKGQMKALANRETSRVRFARLTARCYSRAFHVRERLNALGNFIARFWTNRHKIPHRLSTSLSRLVGGRGVS